MAQFGLGNGAVTFPEFTLPPGVPIGANNGVSQDPVTKFVVLGDNPGGVLSALLNNREIQAGNFTVSLINTPLGLVSQLFAGATIYIDNTNGLQGIITATQVQLNSNVFGGVATLQAADPIASASSFLHLVSPTPVSEITLGTSFRIFENLNGMTIQNNGQSSNFFFDVTNNELKIFTNPESKAGAVIAGKAITSPAGANPVVNLVFPNDCGRVISNLDNAPAFASLTVNVPAGTVGDCFDVSFAANTPGGSVCTINFSGALDIPGQFPGLVGTASGGWINAALNGGEYVRFQCLRTANGTAVNWNILVLDGSSAANWAPF